MQTLRNEQHADSPQVLPERVVGIAYGFFRGTWIKYDTSHLLEILRAQFAQKGIGVQKIGLLDCQIKITSGQLEVINLKTGASLATLDGLYFANWRKHPEFSLAAAVFMQRLGKPVLSEEVLKVLPMTKLGEMVLLSDQNLPLPDSIFMRSKYWLKALKTSNELPFKPPFIVKSIDGSMGGDNYLVNDAAEFRRILEENPELLFVVQRFISNDCDYRLIVIGGRVQIVIRRTRQGAQTHVNNTSQGAAAEIVPLTMVPQGMITIAEKAAMAVGRNSFCGVDVLEDSLSPGSYYILEVNKTPQMETGSNTTEKVAALVDYFADQLEGSK